MVETVVHAGVCGFKTVIEVDSEDMQTAKVKISTECPSLKPLEQELTEVDGYEECFAKVGESNVYEVARKHCRHAACPVPAAILKGIEVACGLALPADVSISITKK